MTQQQTSSFPMQSLRKPIANILLVSIVFAGMFAILLWGGGSVQKAQELFAMDSSQIWWYVTRASGLTGYFLIWLSMVWGFAIPSRIIQPILDNTFTYDFHEHLSLVGLGFIVLHVGVLLLDNYLPFTVFQLLIPFINSYRPLWVGLGILSFYVMLLVTFTFYLRQRIGSRAFRSIHVLSIAGYLGATLHGLLAGTDSALPVAMFLYLGTFLVVVFLTAYWLLTRNLGREARSAIVQKPGAHGR